MKRIPAPAPAGGPTGAPRILVLVGAVVALLASLVVLAPAGTAQEVTCNGLVVTVDLSAGQRPTGGNDVILGTVGDDVIRAWAGDDTICGAGGDDTINGGSGDDQIFGGDGDDQIDGSLGNDTCDGERGANTVTCEQTPDSPPTPVPTPTPTPTPATPTPSGPLTCNGQVATVDLGAGERPTGRDDVIVGTPGDDVIFSWGGDDVICAGGGNDTIHAGGGDDTVFGGAGDDIIDGSIGTDTCDGGDGANTVSCEQGTSSPGPTPTPVATSTPVPTVTPAPTGGPVDPTVATCRGLVATVVLADGDRPTGQDDVIVGTPGDDVINSWDGDDIICAGAGDDVVNGGGGDDQIFGGEGNDSIAGASGYDSCDGESGSNVVTCEAFIDGSDPSATPAPPTATVVPTPTPTPEPWTYTGPTSGAVCGGQDVTVYIGLGDQPTAGDDVILGTDLDEELDGGAGNDIICGDDGDDLLLGGAGADVLYGERGSDQLSGGAGDDQLFGGSDNDTAWGSAGDDVLDGGGKDDDLWGGEGEDIIRGGGGDDLLYGGLGADRIFAGPGEDQVVGGPDADRIDGGQDNDDLRGNGGADDISGGDGIDICNGGDGTEVDLYVTCERLRNDAERQPAPTASTWTPPSVSGPEPLVDWQIAVSFSQADPGDAGVIDFRDGTRQYVTGYCRANLEAHLELVVRDWPTQTEPLRPRTDPDSCSELMQQAAGTSLLARPVGSEPAGLPQMLIRSGLDTQGWLDLGDGRRENITAGCRTYLEDLGLPVLVAPWEYISSLASVDVFRGADSCTAIGSWWQDRIAGASAVDGAPATGAAEDADVANTAPHAHPLGYRILDNPADTADHGWFDFSDGTRQFIQESCVQQLQAVGAVVAAPDFNTFTSQLTPLPAGADFDCEELAALILSPGPAPVGANFKTNGSEIIDPFGQPFVPYGANVSADHYISEGWNSKPVAKLGIYRGVWQFNTLRLNAFCRRACNITGTEQDTTADIHDIIAAYEGTGVAIIVDFHSLDFPNAPTADEIEMSTEYFRDLAERYRLNPYVWFNPYNEPLNECDLNGFGAGLDNVTATGMASTTWVDIHVPVLDAIRAAGNHNMITLTASNFGQDRCQNHTGLLADFQSSILTFGPELRESYANLAFDLHFYSRWHRSSDHAIADYFARAEALGLPIFVGEIGGRPESGLKFQREDYEAAIRFFDSAPDDIGVLAWHSAFGYPLVEGNGGNAFGIQPSDGTTPTNLTPLGLLIWNHFHGSR